MVLTSYYERVHKTGKAILFTDAPNPLLVDAEYIITQCNKTRCLSNCIQNKQAWSGHIWFAIIFIIRVLCLINKILDIYSILWQDDYRVNGQEVCALQPYYLWICSRTKMISQKPSPKIAGPQVGIWNWSLQHLWSTKVLVYKIHTPSAKCFSYSRPDQIPLILLMSPTLHSLHIIVTTFFFVCTMVA